KDEEKETKFHKLGLFLLLLVRSGLFVNRATVLVLHLCSLEHSLAFVLLACCCVIAWLAVDLRLVVVGVEVARIRPVAHIHDESVREGQRIAWFCKARDKKSHDYHQREEAKNHPDRLTRVFGQVKTN